MASWQTDFALALVASFAELLLPVPRTFFRPSLHTKSPLRQLSQSQRNSSVISIAFPSYRPVASACIPCLISNLRVCLWWCSRPTLWCSRLFRAFNIFLLDWFFWSVWTGMIATLTVLYGIHGSTLLFCSSWTLSTAFLVLQWSLASSLSVPSQTRTSWPSVRASHISSWLSCHGLRIKWAAARFYRRVF